jgi:hypothetical protein
MRLTPRYPLYIVSKGRWESRLTSKALEELGVPYRIVVEPQEFDRYAAVITPEKVLTLPFSNLGQGSIPARNWVWEHSIREGHARHWIVDDNISAFYRFNRNLKVPVSSGNIFTAMEDFVDRYDNVPMAGPNYFMFVSRKQPDIKPFTPNTRVYSCILLSNSQKCRHRWRGRYNEDTDLSLRYLKDGYCTILFNAFLAGKTVTMTMKGGNTDELYKNSQELDGRLEMARSLQRQHPDVCKVVRKWGRWQHHVDYRPFKGNKLIRLPGVEVPGGVNDYGMRLRMVEDL